MDKQLELDFNIKESKQDGPVTCLGMAFSDNEARRAHFTELLTHFFENLAKNINFLWHYGCLGLINSSGYCWLFAKSSL